MNSNAKIKSIFLTALEIEPGDERDACVERLCRDDHGLRVEVMRLLAAHASAEEFLEPVIASGAGTDLQWLSDSLYPDVDSSAAVGTVIAGKYELLEQLGQGGMGIVFRARQKEPVDREVAVKVIKPGMDSHQVLARFDMERRTLAMMDHPHIAKILDAGMTAAGRPFFAMELVAGVPLSTYCDSHRLGVRQRIDLFITVCAAVQHAHQKSVVHRDLKPSNVLVARHSGVAIPKVIDFGLAKALRSEGNPLLTLFGSVAGTPTYMAPEQTSGSLLDIDTRVDVYGLGVMLYQLLTGTTPLQPQELEDLSLDEIQQRIRAEIPPLPSQRIAEVAASAAGQNRTGLLGAEKEVRGDLDRITMKCLEKEPSQRYETADALSRDLRRFLADEPIEARPASGVYRLQKFICRNRGLVTAAAIVLTAMCGALVISAVSFRKALVAWKAEAEQRDIAENHLLRAGAEYRRAENEARNARAAEKEAQRRAEELQLVVDFQATQLAGIDVRRFGQRIREGLFSKPDDEGSRTPLASDPEPPDTAMLATFDFTGLATLLLEENFFRPSREAIDRQFESQPLVRARLLQVLSNSIREAGLLEASLEPQEQALQLRRQWLGNENVDTAESLVSLAYLLRSLNKTQQAVTILDDVMTSRLKQAGPEDPVYLKAVAGKAVTLRIMGDYDAADVLFREAIDTGRRVWGENNLLILRLLSSHSALLRLTGKSKEAEEQVRRSLDGLRKTVGESHPDTLSAMNGLANVLKAQGRLKDASQLYVAVVRASRSVMGAEHPATLTWSNNLGSLLMAQGDLREAEEYFREVLNARRRLLGDEHRSTLTSMGLMSVLLFNQGRHEECEALARKVLESRSRTLGPDHPSAVEMSVFLATTLIELGKCGEARTLLSAALEQQLAELGGEHPSTLKTRETSAALLAKEGAFDEADGEFTEVLEDCRRVLGEEHLTTLRVEGQLAMLKLRREQPAEAEVLARHVVHGGELTMPADHPGLLTWRLNLAEILIRQRQFSEAVSILERTHDMLEGKFGANHPETIRAAEVLADGFRQWHDAEPTAGHDLDADMWGLRLRKAVSGKL